MPLLSQRYCSRLAFARIYCKELLQHVIFFPQDFSSVPNIFLLVHAAKWSQSKSTKCVQLSRKRPEVRGLDESRFLLCSKTHPFKKQFRSILSLLSLDDNFSYAESHKSKEKRSPPLELSAYEEERGFIRALKHKLNCAPPLAFGMKNDARRRAGPRAIGTPFQSG